MTYALHVGIEKVLREKKFPVAFAYGPEAFSRRPDRTIVITERGENDRFDAPAGFSRNGQRGEGRCLARRYQSVVITVVSKSSVSGARRQDHEDFCDAIVDAVLCALYNWGASQRQPVSIDGGGYVSADLLPGEYKVFPGVVYQLKASLSRGVYDSDFDGLGLPAVLLDDVTTTVVEQGE